MNDFRNKFPDSFLITFDEIKLSKESGISYLSKSNVINDLPTNVLDKFLIKNYGISYDECLSCSIYNKYQKFNSTVLDKFYALYPLENILVFNTNGNVNDLLLDFLIEHDEIDTYDIFIRDIYPKNFNKKFTEYLHKNIQITSIEKGKQQLIYANKWKYIKLRKLLNGTDI